jgi:hypothetical protein
MMTVCRKFNAMTSPVHATHAETVTYIEGLARRITKYPAKLVTTFCMAKARPAPTSPSCRQAGWIIEPERYETNNAEQEDDDANPLAAPEGSFLAVSSSFCSQKAQEPVREIQDGQKGDGEQELAAIFRVKSEEPHTSDLNFMIVADKLYEWAAHANLDAAKSV